MHHGFDRVLPLISLKWLKYEHNIQYFTVSHEKLLSQGSNYLRHHDLELPIIIKSGSCIYLVPFESIFLDSISERLVKASLYAKTLLVVHGRGKQHLVQASAWWFTHDGTVLIHVNWSTRPHVICIPRHLAVSSRRPFKPYLIFHVVFVYS